MPSYLARPFQNSYSTASIANEKTLSNQVGVDTKPEPNPNKTTTTTTTTTTTALTTTTTTARVTAVMLSRKIPRVTNRIPPPLRVLTAWPLDIHLIQQLLLQLLLMVAQVKASDKFVDIIVVWKPIWFNIKPCLKIYKL